MYIGYDLKNGIKYAKICSSTRIGGKVKTTQQSLGRVIDEENGIYKNRKRGLFTYSLATGEFGQPDPALIPAPARRKQEKLILDFGDAYFLDAYIRMKGLDRAIESIGYGNIDSVWALILPLSVSSFNIIICKTFFRTTIPDSLIESAVIDGANQLRIYFQIILPLSQPVIATIGLFLSFAYWNDWFQTLLYIDNTNLFTLQAYLNRLLGDLNFLAQNATLLGASQAELLASMPKEAARMAIVVAAVLPVACVYPFFQRYFIKGLTLGGVKE